MANREPTSFGALLLEFRAAAGLTQEQLAAHARLSREAIAALERGKRRTPRRVTVELLADALELGAQERAQLAAAARRAGIIDSARAASPVERDRSRPLWRLASAAEPTPVVDRAYELDAIVRSLTSDGVRLLTLTGPAGVGKTRLALTAATSSRLADHFPGGVVWVDIAPVRDSEDVLAAIARTLGLTDTGQPPLPERLQAFLCDRTALLLVLDNFEQVLPAAVCLGNLLVACAGLALLVTSRVPLQLRWEQTLRIAPLPVPDLSEALPPLDELAAIPSITLFIQRARARRADFVLSEKQAPLIARLAAQLDGLPLALELAAARLDVLSLPTLARRLGDRLRLLASAAPDRPERQRSLEAAVDWSYDLLPEAERRLFRCLGVFVGQLSLDAIAAVAGAVGAARQDVDDREAREAREARGAREAGRTLPRLLSLAEKSLLLPVRPAAPAWQQRGGEDAAKDEEDEDPEPAFGMLETVREYAWERLVVEGELEAARRAHAHYFLALAERADPELRGRDQRIWFLRLEREHANLRAALRWLLDRDERDGPDGPAQREEGLRLASALGWFWRMRGYHAEGRRWLKEALARVPEAEGTVRTRALLIAGHLIATHLLTLQGDVAPARAVLEEALALAQHGQDMASVAQALSYLGLFALLAGEVDEGIRRLEEALRRWEALGDPYGLGETHFYLGLAADTTGDTAAAAPHYAAALRWLRAAGDAQLAGHVHCYFGVAEWRRGELPSAAEEVRLALQTGVALRDRHLLTLAAQAAVALVGARDAPAARLLGAADALAQATGASSTMVVWERLPAWRDVVRLSERLAPGKEGEWVAAYREGRALPVGTVAALALRLLEDTTRPQPQRVGAAERAQTREQLAQRPQHPSLLTEREQEVLRLVAQGRSTRDIARELFIAERTVAQHIKSIFNKLGVETRAHAVAVAVQLGLL